MRADISNFNLNDLMGRLYETSTGNYLIWNYSTIQTKKISQKIFLYKEIPKGMYGLPQSVNIANDKLKQHITKFGYDTAPATPGL